MKENTTQAVLIIGTMILSLALSSALVLGQGGTGRNTNAATKPKTPPAKSRSRSRTGGSNGETTNNQNTGETQPATKTEENSATLSETMNWLGSKLTDFGFYRNLTIKTNNGYSEFTNYDSTGDKSSRNISAHYTVNKCVLTLEGEWDFNNSEQGHKRSYKITVVIPFADIDPLSIESKAGYQWFALTTSNSNKTLQIRRDEYRDNIPATSSNEIGSNFNIGFESSQMESKTRVEQAAKHVLKLCGGKSDPF